MKDNINDIIAFIDDQKGSLKMHQQSERFISLHRCSIATFRSNARLEQKIILENYQDLEYVYPYVTILHEYLTIERIRDPDNIFDFGGTFQREIKFKSLASYFQTLEFVVFPEVLTWYLSMSMKCSYSMATKYLYGDVIPTVHHTQYYLGVSYTLFFLQATPL